MNQDEIPSPQQSPQFVTFVQKLSAFDNPFDPLTFSTMTGVRCGGLASTRIARRNAASSILCVTMTVVSFARAATRPRGSAILARRRVERGERLVHEQQVRPQNKRPRDGGALALPARDLAHVLVGDRRDAQSLQPKAHALGDDADDLVCRGMASIRPVEFAQAQTQRGVLRTVAQGKP
jgi:hypothetical protein